MIKDEFINRRVRKYFYQTLTHSMHRCDLTLIDSINLKKRFLNYLFNNFWLNVSY